MSSGELPESERREHQQLAAAFTAMDFTETEADLLASAQVEPWQAKHLLERGCTHKYAVLILI